ncbi:sarcosine oxidase subunit alpha [Mesorhizobium sp. B3-1-3]|nr:sarcosine oxidase subunit alpha [Mesorhizobium sp. B3-1-8]TPI63348.1 sarcosine oxidase subunit alpha [Mesorhizobium sp. B3-1-3]
MAQIVRFFWNGKALRGVAGDTIGEALYRNGILALGRSRKRQQPLGMSGSTSFGVIARVDGRPSVRIDRLLVQPDMQIESQDAWPTRSFNLLRLARHVPKRLLRGGFEQTMLFPSGTARFRYWERFLSHISAGGARLPDRVLAPEQSPARVVPADILVIGGGPAGIAEANRLALAGRVVTLVTRGDRHARSASLMAREVAPLHENVTSHLSMDVFGIYRAGRIVAGAPCAGDDGVTFFKPSSIIIATGRFSIPPVVPGGALPGVLAAPVALQLACRSINLGRVVVCGTGSEAEIADRLQSLGASVVEHVPTATVERVTGGNRVRGIFSSGRLIRCETLVHGGPWRADPSLEFQAVATGTIQLRTDPDATPVHAVGAYCQGSERIHINEEHLEEAEVCACMDVTGGELLSLVRNGVEDVEVLKRLTSCGMGPCQGNPCWHSMAELVARFGVSGKPVAMPSYRPPRGAITVAQAAGLLEVASAVE